MDDAPRPAADIDEAIRKCFKDGWRNLEIHLSKHRYDQLIASGVAHWEPTEIVRSEGERSVGTYRGYPVFVARMETSNSTVLNRFENGSLRGWAI